MSRQKREHDLRLIKAAAKVKFGGMEGVEGIGVGPQSLRFYVRDDAVRKQLPSQFQGVHIDVVVTGVITALPE